MEALFRLSRRSFSTSVCQCARKTYLPFDKRFPVKARHVTEFRKGGNKYMEMLLRPTDVPATGYFDVKKMQYVIVKEMIPEFIVPDLEGFNLKPYVTYSVKDEVKQDKMTAKDLFNLCYADHIIEKYKKGEINEEDIELILEESKNVHHEERKSEKEKSEDG